MTTRIDAFRGRFICRIGQGAACCRYVTATIDLKAVERGGAAVCCAKHDPGLRVQIDQRVAAATMVARGDNCEGLRNG